MRTSRRDCPLSSISLLPVCLWLFSLPSIIRSQQVGSSEALFPPNDEFDFSILDPTTDYGSPYGGFARATASRLAQHALRLPPLAQHDHHPHTTLEEQTRYWTVHDYLGREYVCRVYLQDELDPISLTDSLWDAPDLLREASSSASSALDDDDDDDNVRTSIDDDDDGSDSSLQHIQQPSSFRDMDLDDIFSTFLQDGEWDESMVEHEMALATNRRLEQIRDMCVQFHQGWWSYEWCAATKVTQFHVHIRVNDVATAATEAAAAEPALELQHVTNLGTLRERRVLPGTHFHKTTSDELMDEDQRELARVMEIFAGGDRCGETDKFRETHVIVRCCSSKIMKKVARGGVLYKGQPQHSDLLRMYKVEEDPNNLCHYDATVCTPLLCAGERKMDEGDMQPPSSNLRLPNKIEDMSVEQVVAFTFGGVSTPTKQRCIQYGKGDWWVYELCPGLHVKQFHEVTLMDRISGAATKQIEVEHILGRYQPEIHGNATRETDWEHVVNATKVAGNEKLGRMDSRRQHRQKRPTAHGGNGAYYFQEYTSGDICDHEDVTDSAIKAGTFGEGGIERASTVRYSCGTKIEMTVKEDSTCHYIVGVSLPNLCKHPLFQAPVSKKQVVKCLLAP